MEHNGARYWLCKICHLQTRYSEACYSGSGTSHPTKHLLRRHKITESGELDVSSQNPFTITASSASSRASNQLGFPLATRWTEEMWKKEYIDWVIFEDIMFNQASSDRLRRLIVNGGDLCKKLLPESHTTVSSWVFSAFETRREQILELVKNAKSSIHMSFDLWTSEVARNYLGIISHFIDAKGLKRDILLGFPRVIGPHSGENLASYIRQVIDQYEFSGRLGYFITDNAESNDTCLQKLSHWFPIDVNKRRLRCIGHIINLVVRAVIFGENVSKFEAELHGANDDLCFDIWAKRGAIGRLHNLIITYIRRWDQRREQLRELQVEIGDRDLLFTYELIVDGKTRWNSVFLMIKRGQYSGYIYAYALIYFNLS